MMRAAVLDDYARVAATCGPWREQLREVDVNFFHDHVDDPDQLVARLQHFEIVCAMRERSRFPRDVLERLPELRLLVATGRANSAIDFDAARTCGVTVSTTRSLPHGTPELTWGLILALARRIPREDQLIRLGGWQTQVGIDLQGSTLGILGLGRIGQRVARVGQAFGMNVIAWSPRLSAASAEEQGVRLAERTELFQESDIVSIHVSLTPASRGLVGRAELASMRSDALLINTSRGAVVDEAALVDALRNNQIAGAGLDVYAVEPLAANHPLRSLPNTVLMPHSGHVTQDTLRLYYSDAIENIRTWLDGAPLRVRED